jgi:ElaB/YqjD/DUF883 family membrane-anchored ribosome-binding protein
MEQTQSTKPPGFDEEVSNASDQMKSQIKEACEKYGKQYENIHDKVEEISQTIIKTTKKKPIFALGVAVAVGVFIGKLLKK